MKTSFRRFTWLASVVLLGLAACVPVETSPTVTALPSPSEAPTAAPAPTALPTPTPIPELLWPAEGAYFGAWVGPPKSSERLVDNFETFEGVFGRELDIIHTYYGFRYVPEMRAAPERFPPALVTHYLPEQRIFLFSFDLRTWEKDTGRTDILTLQKIIGGDFDDMLRKWAITVRALEYPVIFRFAWEMNIEWTSSGGPRNFGPEGDQPWYQVADKYGQYGDPKLADGPERFRDAVNRVMDIFEETGAENVYWAFGPNWISYPRDPWNTLESYWIERWDVIAPTLCAYKDDWRSFQQMYEAEIAPFVESHPRPVVIAEWSVPDDPRKARHYQEAFTYIQTRPEIKGMVVFAEDVWHPGSNPESREAFLEILKSDYLNP